MGVRQEENPVTNCLIFYIGGQQELIRKESSSAYSLLKQASLARSIAPLGYKAEMAFWASKQH